jgi:hypothetical protein
MSGAIPPFPQYLFMAWYSAKAQGQLYLSFPQHYQESWQYLRIRPALFISGKMITAVDTAFFSNLRTNRPCANFHTTQRWTSCYGWFVTHLTTPCQKQFMRLRKGWEDDNMRWPGKDSRGSGPELFEDLMSSVPGVTVSTAVQTRIR